jgi:hypothetical protein
MWFFTKSESRHGCPRSDQYGNQAGATYYFLRYAKWQDRTRAPDHYARTLCCMVCTKTWMDGRSLNVTLGREVSVILMIRILGPFLALHSESKFCLVMDTMSAHKTNAVKRKLEELGVLVAFIPGGLTGELQPLDVGINYPFKHWMTSGWAEDQETIPLSPIEKRKKLARLIISSWNMITHDTVVNSFWRMLAHVSIEVLDLEEI